MHPRRPLPPPARPEPVGPTGVAAAPGIAAALADALLGPTVDPGPSVEQALALLGPAIGAVHIGVCIVDASSRRIARLPGASGDQPWTYTWDAVADEPSWVHVGDPDFEGSRRYLDLLGPVEVITIPDVAGLPDDFGEERERLVEHGIRSWVVVGRRTRRDTLDCIVRAHGVGPELCTPEAVAALRLLAALVVPLIARVDEALRVLAAFDDLPHAAAVLDPTLRLLDANEAYLELVGATIDEVVGRRPTQLRPVGPAGLDEIAPVLDGRADVVVVDRRVERGDGVERRLRIEVRAVRTTEGRVRCVVAHITDTTDLWVAERELTERLAGSNLVAEVLTLLQPADVDAFDDALEEVLARIGRSLDLDVVELRDVEPDDALSFRKAARWATGRARRWPCTDVVRFAPELVRVPAEPRRWTGEGRQLGDWPGVPVVEQPRWVTSVLVPVQVRDDGGVATVLVASVAGRRAVSELQLGVLRSVASTIGGARHRHEAEVLFAEAFRRAPVGINLRDVRRQLLDCSDAFAEMVDRRREELLGRPMEELVVPRPEGVEPDAWPAHYDGATMQLPLRRGDGQVIWIRGRRSTVRLGPRGDVAITHIEDVTDRIAQERALADSEARYRGLVETAPVAITGLDADLGVRFHNPAGLELLGAVLPVGEPILGCLVGGGVDPSVLRASLASGAPVALEWTVPGPNGLRTMASSLVPEVAPDGSPSGATVFTAEVTEVRRHQDELRRQAHHDELTGLANRRSLLEHIEGLEASVGGGALLLVDLDRFKVVNDSLGHPVGDRLLLTVADRIRLCCRPGDLVARLGGDEFAVLLSGPVDALEAAAVADRLLEAIRRPIDLDGRYVVTGASIGIAFAETTGDPASELVRQADAAMYRAKETGRNRYELFDDDLRASVAHRIEVESELRRALAEGRFRLHLQPEVDILTGQALGCEALLRWDHPDGVVRSAADFIDVAEETGLILDLGAWILEEAGRQAGRLLDVTGRRDLVVRVNLSARQLRDPLLPELVARALELGAIGPANLCLEITETTLMSDVEEVQRVLSDLRRLGVHLAVDDFGTGFSSLAYLQRFPIDILKIDRSFVTGLGVDAQSSAIVASVIGLAEGLGLEVVAEGVEEQRQVEVLAELGCRRVQGYLFARPAPFDEVVGCFDGRPFVDRVPVAGSSHPSRAS